MERAQRRKGRRDHGHRPGAIAGRPGSQISEDLRTGLVLDLQGHLDLDARLVGQGGHADGRPGVGPGVSV